MTITLKTSHLHLLWRYDDVVMKSARGWALPTALSIVAWLSAGVTWLSAGVTWLSVGDAFAVETVHFEIPAGWTDLSPGAPEGNFARIPTEWRLDARNGGYAALAIDVRTPKEGMADLSALIEPGAQPVNDGFLNWFPANITDEMAKQTPGLKVSVKDKRLVQMSGLAVAEFHLESRMESGSESEITEQLLYVMPAGDRHLQLTYSAPSLAFARYRPIFEASARNTTGLAREPQAKKQWSRALEYLGFAALIVVIALRKRKQNQSK